MSNSLKLKNTLFNSYFFDLLLVLANTLLYKSISILS